MDNLKVMYSKFENLKNSDLYFIIGLSLFLFILVTIPFATGFTGVAYWTLRGSEIILAIGLFLLGLNRRNAFIAIPCVLSLFIHLPLEKFFSPNEVLSIKTKVLSLSYIDRPITAPLLWIKSPMGNFVVDQNEFIEGSEVIVKRYSSSDTYVHRIEICTENNSCSKVHE